MPIRHTPSALLLAAALLARGASAQTLARGRNEDRKLAPLAAAAHNGGAAETVIAFGAIGAIPLLGDYDGDGRDDACTYAGGTFRCDTAHNGGTAEATLTVNGPGRPLIGNVDGL
jgi:hypothetical protein